MNIDILNYIQNARKSGMGDDKIREGLLQAGYQVIDIDEALRNSSPSPIEAKPKWHPTPLQKWIAIIGTIAILAMSGAYAYVSYLAGKNYEEVSRQARKAQEDIQALEQRRADLVVYKNDTFGFSIELSADWKGYTVNQIKEDIYDLTGRTTTNNGVVDSFQIIELHHPSETPDNPREVMPIMILTQAQWGHIFNEEWSVGAAPVPPTLLGQNSQWIIALPARYNYDFEPGWEEVDQLIRTIKVFEPGANTSDWQTYRNEEYRFEFKYPGDWRVDECSKDSIYFNGLCDTDAPSGGDIQINSNRD
jgi:hypothetical protein